jgi:hypothetical protein
MVRIFEENQLELTGNAEKFGKRPAGPARARILKTTAMNDFVESKIKTSVIKILSSGTNSQSISILTLPRDVRKLLYSIYISTNDNGSGELKTLNGRIEKDDIDLFASKFASWLVIKTNQCREQGIISEGSSSDGRDKFMNWLIKSIDSSRRSPDESNSAARVQNTKI